MALSSEKLRRVKGAASHQMPGSGVSTRPRVDTFLILSSMKLPLIVSAAVGVVVGVAVGFIVGVAMMLQRAIALTESESKLPKAKA
jgi:thiazole synthase ThiGH ThiG subunit